MPINPIERFLVNPSPERDVVRIGINRVLDHPDYVGARVVLVEVSDAWTTINFEGGRIVGGQVAIWNETGNVYHLDEYGAVVDDPFIEVTPL